MEPNHESNQKDATASIPEETVAECVGRVKDATSSVFRSTDSDAHDQYAKLFVAEVIRRLSKVVNPQIGLDECLLGAILCFVREVKRYKASTSLYEEVALMSQVVTKEVQKRADELESSPQN